MPRVKLKEIQTAREQNLGYCMVCLEWTGECVEPDAQGYECPKCNGPHVVGAETLLFEVL